MDDVDLVEKEVGRSVAFACSIFSVVHLRVTVGENRIEDRWIVERQPTVSVIPIRDDGAVLAIRQFRTGSNKISWRLPSGHLEDGEDVHSAAARELVEETGLSCRQLALVSEESGRSGWVREKCTIFSARVDFPPRLAKGDERVEGVWLSNSDLRTLVYDFAFSPHISKALVATVGHNWPTGMGT